MLRAIHHTPSGRTLIVGSRKAPKPGHHPGLSLRKYLRGLRAMTLPASISYATLAATSLSQMYLNDSLGDCVIAGGYHLLGIATGNADGGSPFIATPGQITSDYSAIGGYVPGNPATDGGCDQPTAFAYWMGVNGGKGFADGSYLGGYANVDATNVPEVQTAIVSFESVTFGVGLPDAWVSAISTLKPGDVWDVAGPANPDNGHDFIACGYDSVGVQICTWGMIITITWAAVAAYAVESAEGALYALLSDEQIAKGQTTSPNGLNWTTLLADLEALPGEITSGHAPAVPPPNPAPPAPPAPTPTPPAPSPGPAPIPSPSPSPGDLAATLASIDAAAQNDIDGLLDDASTAVDQVLQTAADARAAAVQAWASGTAPASATTPTPTPPVTLSASAATVAMAAAPKATQPQIQHFDPTRPTFPTPPSSGPAPAQPTIPRRRTR